MFESIVIFRRNSFKMRVYCVIIIIFFMTYYHFLTHYTNIHLVDLHSTHNTMYVSQVNRKSFIHLFAINLEKRRKKKTTNMYENKFNVMLVAQYGFCN